jgi:hypothetical protein
MDEREESQEESMGHSETEKLIASREFKAGA